MLLLDQSHSPVHLRGGVKIEVNQGNDELVSVATEQRVYIGNLSSEGPVECLQLSQ